MSPLRILYVAKHGSGGNCDEEAIAQALRQHGHVVDCIPESRGCQATRRKADFLLFHHWSNTRALAKVRMPKVFWYFDLVDYNDPTLRLRNTHRITWMDEILPRVNLGFCTDGDWVDQDRSKKLVHLPQGADGRIVNIAADRSKAINILFAGIQRGGKTRFSFVEEMRKVYGQGFRHIQRDHRESLAKIIADTKVVVAPDGPVTDKYWSNRVYITLGFGGFLLHPYCRLLASHYIDGEEIVFYHDRKDLHGKLEYLLQPSVGDYRRQVQEAGYKRTVAEHTYAHRCQKLTRIVRERLL